MGCNATALFHSGKILSRVYVRAAVPRNMANISEEAEVKRISASWRLDSTSFTEVTFP